MSALPPKADIHNPGFLEGREKLRGPQKFRAAGKTPSGPALQAAKRLLSPQ
jgi:hypothetical protein